MTLRTLVAALALALSATALPLRTSAAGAAAVIRVPEEAPTIQAAVNRATSGDVIDIAPGTYHENLVVDVGVTLRARVYSVADPRANSVIVDGNGANVISVPEGVSPGPAFVGLVIADGNNGIITNSRVRVAHSSFVGNDYDSLEFDLGGGGVSVNCVMVRSGDDGVDVDHAVRDVLIQGARILNSGNDGVEIRLHDDVVAPTVEVVIAESVIVGSAEDGVQVIDYYADTNRKVVVRRTIIRDNTLAGIGLMDDAATNEDFRAASIRERIHVFHNTFVGNDHGISGGDNLIALNNIFQGHALALKHVDARSIASHNLFWRNAVDARLSVLDRSTSVFANPRLTPSLRLEAGSAAIDQGTAWFRWRREVVMDQAPSRYRGDAPDIGRYERGR